MRGDNSTIDKGRLVSTSDTSRLSVRGGKDHNVLFNSP